MASLTDVFAKEVERRILTGEWKVGERIPPLRLLAEEFYGKDVDEAFVLTTHARLVDAIERRDAEEAEKQMAILSSPDPSLRKPPASGPGRIAHTGCLGWRIG